MQDKCPPTGTINMITEEKPRRKAGVGRGRENNKAGCLWDGFLNSRGALGRKERSFGAQTEKVWATTSTRPPTTLAAAGRREEKAGTLVSSMTRTVAIGGQPLQAGHNRPTTAGQPLRPGPNKQQSTQTGQTFGRDPTPTLRGFVLVLMGGMLSITTHAPPRGVRVTSP